MVWKSGKIQPGQDGIYACLVEFYKPPYDIKAVNLEYYGEWKITDTWDVVLWKNRVLD